MPANNVEPMKHMTIETDRRAFLSHILPFILWLLAMETLPKDAGGYAIRSALGLGLLLWFRPWRYYARFEFNHLPLALFTGIAVFVIWILPELPFFQRWPAAANLYSQWGIFNWPPAAPTSTSPYAPDLAGWPLAIIRLLGSAFIIAAIEEFFWRGFLYRWLIERDFLGVDLSRWQSGPFWITVCMFGIEHNRWLVGMLAGIAYGLLTLRTKNLWPAIIAHMVTNLLLGIYVLSTGDYRFW